MGHAEPDGGLVSPALPTALDAVLAAPAPARIVALDDLHRLVFGAPARDLRVLERLGNLGTAAHGRGRAEERAALAADVNAFRERLKGGR